MILLTVPTFVLFIGTVDGGASLLGNITLRDRPFAAETRLQKWEINFKLENSLQAQTYTMAVTRIVTSTYKP